MTTNTTVDILKYTASPTANTSGPKASATKSYADKSDNFTNILDTANKTYSTQTTSSNNSNNTHHMSNTSSTSKNSAQNTNTVNKNQENSDIKNQTKTIDNSENTKTEVVSEQESKVNKTTSESNQTQEEIKNTNTNTTSMADEKSTTAEEETSATIAKTAAEKIADEADSKELTDNKAATAEAKAIADANAVALSAEETAAVPETSTNAKTETKPNDTKKADDEDKEDSTSSIKSTENGIQVIDLTELGIANAVENIVTPQPQALNTENVDSAIDPNTNNIQSVQAKDAKSVQDNIKMDMGQLTQPNLKNILSKESNSPNIQQSGQQNGQENGQIGAAESKVAQQNTATQTDELNNQDANVDSPVIKVNTEAIASDINLNAQANDKNTQLNTKNILDKASITQDIIDKTNAKITSVQNGSSSDSTSDNLLNKQHAGEQAIKLALENNGNNNKETTQNVAQPIVAVAQNVDLTNITINQVTQSPQTQSTNFAKTLENVQMPIETPQELDKTDILSQINNKLDGFKEEGTSKISIILRPENLGKINLEFINSKEGLTAKITADSAQVKELLDKNLDSLKDTLGNQGVNVNNVSVKVAEGQKQDSTNYFEQQNQQTNQQQSNNKQMTGQGNGNGNGFSLNDEANNFKDTTEANQELEDIASTNTETNSEKVDYKV